MYTRGGIKAGGIEVKKLLNFLKISLLKKVTSSISCALPGYGNTGMTGTRQRHYAVPHSRAVLRRFFVVITG